MATNTLNYPKQIVQIEGKEKVTSMYDVLPFNPTDKVESEILINNSSGVVSVFLPYVVPVRKIIIEAPIYNSSLENVYSITLNTTYSVSGINTTISENIEGITIKSYSKAYGLNITNVSLQTSSSDFKTIKCKIYSWDD